MLGVLAVEAIEQARRTGHDLASARVVGVEGAQRVEIDAPPHLRGQGVLVLVQVGLQLGAVGGAHLGRAE